MKRIAIILIPLSFLFACKKDDTQTATASIIDTTAFTIKVNNSTEQGIILFAPYTAGVDSGKIIITDAKGNILKEQITAGTAMNFEKWNINGQTRYSYLLQDKGGYHIPNYSGSVSGHMVITDENLNVIKTIYLKSYGDIDASTQNLVDAHDFILLSENHYIVQSYYDKNVTNIPGYPNTTVDVVDPVIQEVNNDQVVWQWEGANHPELYAHSLEGNSFGGTGIQDYLHLNSMYVDPTDGNLICSFRNADQIMKLSRTSDSVVWTLGGVGSDFPVSTDQQFIRQHHVTLINNNATLLIYDDGDATIRPYTRIEEITLDQVNKNILSYSVFNVPGLFTQYMGSVQKIGDNYFLGCGTVKSILEYNSLTGEKLFDLSLGQYSYRALKYTN